MKTIIKFILMFSIIQNFMCLGILSHTTFLKNWGVYITTKNANTIYQFYKFNSMNFVFNYYLKYIKTTLHGTLVCKFNHNHYYFLIYSEGVIFKVHFYKLYIHMQILRNIFFFKFQLICEIKIIMKRLETDKKCYKCKSLRNE